MEADGEGWAVYIGDCDLGRGAFAGRDFAEGEVLFRFTGAVITTAQAVAKGERMGDPLQVGPDRYLDLGSPGMFLNHSCAPNAGVADDVFLVALRDIRRGEEVRMDYSTTMWEDLWVMECQCGSLRCRRTVTDFPLLPAELQRSYLRRGVVQSFIVRGLQER